MKSKLVLMSLFLFPWGTMTQAWGQHCSCADKETLAINQAVNQGGITLTQAVLPRLQNPSVVAFANALLAGQQASYNELAAMSVNAGIPPKPNDMSIAAAKRAAHALQVSSALSGAALDRAYVDFQVNELTLLITATDTYFIPKVITPAMKAWLPGARARLVAEFNAAKSVQQKVNGRLAIHY